MNNREAVAAAIDAGVRVKFVFFWGHKAPDGAVTKACFSQWSPAPFTVEGARYATAEHFMMVEKARLFGDHAVAAQILAAADPGKAKALGRRVARFEASLWDQAKVDIVVRGNVEKFRQNPEMGAFLRATGDRVLVEASPVDRVWGVGLAADDPRCEDPRQWRGENLLGFALMEARRRLLESAPPADD